MVSTQFFWYEYTNITKFISFPQVQKFIMAFIQEDREGKWNKERKNLATKAQTAVKEYFQQIRDYHQQRKQQYHQERKKQR